MKATYKKYILNFKQPSGTSRGVMRTKETWFLILEQNGKFGIGECGLLRGLSIDDRADYEQKLQWVCENIHLGQDVLYQKLVEFPSIQFGIEQAFLSLASEHPFKLFNSSFLTSQEPIAINGLIWMGDEDFMLKQIDAKLKEGFQCIKMKIGAIDFDKEISILQSIRRQYSKDKIELRVDANGAFSLDDAEEKLQILADLDIHSIEQPIKQGQLSNMAALYKNSPLPIALDEELIGVFDIENKKRVLQTIMPQYIILKPSLIGGFQGSSEWIQLAEALSIGWWITSALESNIGLNAIAQFTSTLNNKLPQGLGTGGLYTNNFQSPLTVAQGTLSYHQNKKWQKNLIKELCI